MPCNRCHGLLIREQTWSADNDFREVSFIRCVNCGNYQFVKKEGAPSGANEIEVSAVC